MKGLLASMVLGLIVLPAAWSAEDRFKATSDKDFLVKAIAHNLGEAEISNYALQNLNDDKVKDFAQRLVALNKTLDDALTTHSQRLKVAVVTGEDTETRDRLDTLTKLKAKGYAFDREYIKQMIECQGQSIRLYESEIANGKDADLKAMAREVLPTLKKHLEDARKYADKLKKYGNAQPPVRAPWNGQEP